MFSQCGILECFCLTKTTPTTPPHPTPHSHTLQVVVLNESIFPVAFIYVKADVGVCPSCAFWGHLGYKGLYLQPLCISIQLCWIEFIFVLTRPAHMV